MSKALKCDRCGDFYIPDDSHRNRLSFFNYDYDDGIYDNCSWLDLCPGCADLLESWLERPTRETEDDE